VCAFNRCEGVIANEGCYECDGCLGSTAMWLEPGQSTEASWDGGFFPDATLPGECDPSGCQVCYHRTIPDVKSVWVEVTAYTECTQADSEPCACYGGEPPCEVPVDTLDGPIQVAVEVDLSIADAVPIPLL
jgi:hypothetical protein